MPLKGKNKSKIAEMVCFELNQKRFFAFITFIFCFCFIIIYFFHSSPKIGAQPNEESFYLNNILKSHIYKDWNDIFDDNADIQPEQIHYTSSARTKIHISQTLYIKYSSFYKMSTEFGVILFYGDKDDSKLLIEESTFSYCSATDTGQITANGDGELKTYIIRCCCEKCNAESNGIFCSLYSNNTNNIYVMNDTTIGNCNSRSKGCAVWMGEGTDISNYVNTSNNDCYRISSLSYSSLMNGTIMYSSIINNTSQDVCCLYLASSESTVDTCNILYNVQHGQTSGLLYTEGETVYTNSFILFNVAIAIFQNVYTSCLLEECFLDKSQFTYGGYIPDIRNSYYYDEEIYGTHFLSYFCHGSYLFPFDRPRMTLSLPSYSIFKSFHLIF